MWLTTAITLAIAVPAHAQQPPGPRTLAVVRDYDGTHPTTASSVVTVHMPLDIVRRYDGRDDSPIVRRFNDPPTPIESAPSAAGARAPGVMVSIDDAGESARVRPIRPILLLGYDGDEVAFTARDPAVQLLSIIADFDATVPTPMARVFRAYDVAGVLIRVETALPPMRVVTTSAGPVSGPTVSIGAAVTSEPPRVGARPRTTRDR